jgi:hypothetical protein
MKRPVLLILSFATFGLSLSSCGDGEKTAHEKTEEAQEQGSIENATLEQLGASFILTLKENDSTSIEDLLPAKEDFEKIVSVYSGSEEEKKSILAGSAKNAQKIRANTMQSFSDFRKKGLDSGIKWEEAAFSNAEYEVKKESNIESAKLQIVFTYKEMKYKINIDECIKTDRGWLIFDKPKWKG